MFFTGKAKYYNDTIDKIETLGFFVDADNYAEALEKIIQHYGENELVGFSIEPLSSSSVLEFNDINLYHKAHKHLETTAIW